MRSRFVRRRFVMVILAVLACMSGFGNAALAQEKDSAGKLITLEIGQGENAIRVVIDPSRAKAEMRDSALVLSGAVVDFSVPFKARRTTLTRAWTGGEVLVNQIWFMPAVNGGHRPMVVRYTTRGTGGGKGKIGLSLVLGFCLDKFIRETGKKAEFLVPGKGILAASGGGLSVIGKFIKEDLAAAKAQSKSYTALAGAGKNDAFFIGFALWDPTSAKSRSGAFFEFSASQSTKKPWRLSGNN